MRRTIRDNFLPIDTLSLGVEQAQGRYRVPPVVSGQGNDVAAGSRGSDGMIDPVRRRESRSFRE
jgi:hypothetical protein